MIWSSLVDAARLRSQQDRCGAKNMEV